jgi:hypothetical protein
MLFLVLHVHLHDSSIEQCALFDHDQPVAADGQQCDLIGPILGQTRVECKESVRDIAFLAVAM